VDFRGHPSSYSFQTVGVQVFPGLCPTAVFIALPMVFVIKTIVFAAVTMVSDVMRIVCIPKTIFSIPATIVFSTEKIFFATETIVFVGTMKWPEGSNENRAIDRHAPPKCNERSDIWE
jgi:hypothetical protein